MYPKKLEDAPKSMYTEEEVFAPAPPLRVKAYRERECRVGMHAHDYHELMIVLSGSGFHYIGEMRIPIERGAVFVIPPFVKHGCYCREGEALTVCYFLLPSAFMRRYAEEMRTLPGFAALFEIEPALRSVYSPSLFLCLPQDALLSLEGRLAELSSIGESGAYPDFVTLSLIGELCRRMHLAGKTHAGDREILALLDYIGNHFGEHLTLSDLAKAARMSRATLHRRFRAVTQTGPMDYLMSVRTRAAGRMLAEGRLSRTEIALSCGFFDTSHMLHRLARMRDREQ